MQWKAFGWLMLHWDLCYVCTCVLISSITTGPTVDICVLSRLLIIFSRSSISILFFSSLPVYPLLCLFASLPAAAVAAVSHSVGLSAIWPTLRSVRVTLLLVYAFSGYLLSGNNCFTCLIGSAIYSICLHFLIGFLGCVWFLILGYQTIHSSFLVYLSWQRGP